jgi:hypothetical protein
MSKRNVSSAEALRTFIVGLAVISAAYALWSVGTRRSATVRLEPAGYDLSYTIAWGWGMEEKLTLARVDALLPVPSSEWLEIWKKPYNSGLAVYRSSAGTYYFGSIYKLFIFEPSVGALRASCSPDDVPARTPFGMQLSNSGNSAANETIDPGARHLFSYIEPNQNNGPIPEDPSGSRYYADLKYLGKFGLVRSEGRGNEIRFVPPSSASEPRLALGVQCG